MSHSAAYGAGYSFGTAIGYIVVCGGVLALGIWLGKRLARRREDTELVRWPAGIAVGLIAILLIGQCSAPTNAQPLGQSAPAENDVIIQQQIIGPASRLAVDFTPDFLDNYTMGVRAGTLNTLKQKGADIDQGSLNVTSDILQINDHKILRSKIRYSCISLQEYPAIIPLLSCAHREAPGFSIFPAHRANPRFVKHLDEIHARIAGVLTPGPAE